MWRFIVNFVLVAVLARQCLAGCSSAYGTKPCSFLPAPPGHAPPCAKRPGDTFCEDLPQYPMQHIKYLVEKWGYDYSTLFSSETRDEYSTYFAQPDYGYGTNKGHPGGFHPQPSHPSSYYPGGNQFTPPSGSGRPNHDNFPGYPDRRPVNKGVYPDSYYNQNRHLNHTHIRSFLPPSSFDHTNQEWKPTYYESNLPWRSNNLYQPHYRNKRSRKKPELPKNGTEPNRVKRQSALSSGQSLCQTRSQYIMPKAAVNKAGNWMYVVNLQGVDDRLTQLVKSETCASEQCSGLCGLPLGYSSRCEQRYVQKRLVALEGQGQKLYTDVFWFPSCCICTISGGGG